MLKGFTRKFKALDLLKDEDVQHIHKTILRVLQKTGVKFENKEALKDLEKIGW